MNTMDNQIIAIASAAAGENIADDKRYLLLLTLFLHGGIISMFRLSEANGSYFRCAHFSP